MITPEEIKVWLATEIAVHYHLPNPEPRLTPREFMFLEKMHGETLAYIEQLEADNASKRKRIDELEARLAQVEKKNAALLHDLKTADQECLFCKRNKFPDENCCCECGECQTPCACFSCKDNQYYLWSGVSEKKHKGGLMMRFYTSVTGM